MVLRPLNPREQTITKKFHGQEEEVMHEIRVRWRQLIKVAHSDKATGSHDLSSDLNRAYVRALKLLGFKEKTASVVPCVGELPFSQKSCPVCKGLFTARKVTQRFCCISCSNRNRVTLSGCCSPSYRKERFHGSNVMRQRSPVFVM